MQKEKKEMEDEERKVRKEKEMERVSKGKER